MASAQARQDFSWPPATHRPGRAHHQQLGAWWCPPTTPPPQQGPPPTSGSVVVPPQHTFSTAGPTTNSTERVGAIPPHPLPSRAHHQQLRAWWCPPATPPPQQGPRPTFGSVVVPPRHTPSPAGPTTNSWQRGGALPSHLLPGRAHHQQLRAWSCPTVSDCVWEGPVSIESRVRHASC